VILRGRCLGAPALARARFSPPEFFGRVFLAAGGLQVSGPEAQGASLERFEGFVTGDVYVRTRAHVPNILKDNRNRKKVFYG
jgi:hypothetical protein